MSDHDPGPTTGGLRSSLRWLVRGERNVTAALGGLTESVARLDELVAAHDRDLAEQQTQFSHALDELNGRLDELAQYRRADAWAVADPVRTDGVNVVGYLQRQLGIGDVARRLVTLLRSTEFPTSAIAFGASTSPTYPADFELSQRLAFDTTIAVVAADQLGVLHRTHPEAYAASGRMIGYCFWELETLTDAMRHGLTLVDEVWTGSRFIQQAFSAEGTKPVHHIPIPVAEPTRSDRARSTFGPLAGLDDRIVFGVVFDHFSVMERKNPIGAIRAFTQAFAPDEGPVLVIKTLNGESCPDQVAELVGAIGNRPDVVVWDEHLPHDDHMALIASFDVLVSLHRSEGLGLHLAEAMWFEVPVIATAYSGNLDFMDDDCALLVDHGMTPVRAGRGIYPDDAMWADPDLDAAAEAMQRLASSDDLRRRLGGAGRERMIAQADEASAVATITRLLGRTPADP